ncbi:hypothetical protein PSPO_a3240 [Pseudoalteromonas spongiae UST010723-006]|nr:hypothetical protein PSPO_a3240 [Pseudoalteromonas spongiae UST010723-006]
MRFICITYQQKKQLKKLIFFLIKLLEVLYLLTLICKTVFLLLKL